MVTCQSYRNPALLAKIAAGVDVMSGGRLDFGVGAGWKDFEYKAYGYPFPDGPTRVTQLIETLEICTRMWKEERATFQGKHYRIDDETWAQLAEHFDEQQLTEIVFIVGCYTALAMAFKSFGLQLDPELVDVAVPDLPVDELYG